VCGSRKIEELRENSIQQYKQSSTNCKFTVFIFTTMMRIFHVSVKNVILENGKGHVDKAEIQYRQGVDC